MAESMYVKDFSDINFDDFELDKPVRLSGNSYEVRFKSKTSDDGFYTALPMTEIDDLNIINVSNNGFLKLDVAEDSDFSDFLKDFDKWIINLFSKKYPNFCKI